VESSILDPVDLGFAASLTHPGGTAAATLGLALDVFRASGPGKERTTLFREATRRGCKAVQVLEVPANITDFAQIAGLATAFRLPAVFPGGWQHDGLMSYGTSLLQTIPEMPPMIDLILRGTPPGEIPITQVRRHRLRVNLAAARRMGFGMPPDLLAQADEVVR
jgi:putative tryptophan/tyrosine transport system substrate-binding protein